MSTEQFIVTLWHKDNPPSIIFIRILILRLLSILIDLIISEAKVPAMATGSESGNINIAFLFREVFFIFYAVF